MWITRNKLFFMWDWKKEERWLNGMAAQGWHFVKFQFPCRYVFEQGEPGAYEYRLQCLEHRIGSQESQEYLAFLRDAGIELADSYLCWAYLRKKADGHPFELFSDVPSQMRHVRRLMMIPALSLMALGCSLTMGANILLNQGGPLGAVLVALECLLAVLMCFGIGRLLGVYLALAEQRRE